MLKKAVVHIGMEKTGSTTIQHFLEKNSARLLESDWLLPVSTRSSGPNHSSFAAYALEDESTDSAIRARSRFAADDVPDAGTYRTLLRERIAREIEESGATRLLISSEDLSRLFKLSEVERLAELLFGLAETVEIVVFMRRQDLLASSRFYTLLLGRRPQQKVLVSANQPIPQFYRYEENIENWISVFGLEAMKVVIYPEAPSKVGFDSVDAFCAATGIDATGFDPVVLKNLSRDAVTQIIMRNYLATLPSDSKTSIPEELLDRLSKDQPRLGRFIISKRSAMRFYERVEESNIRLFERLGMPDAIFSKDFSMYPTEAELRHYHEVALRRVLKRLPQV